MKSEELIDAKMFLLWVSAKKRSSYERADRESYSCPQRHATVHTKIIPRLPKI